jgi:Peptidase MA superfamily
MAERAACKQRWLVLALAVSIASGWCLGAPCGGKARAASPNCTCSDCETARWHVVETDSFRILNFGRSPVSRQIAAACERMRAELARQWLPETDGSVWSPKCDLVLHPTDKAYLVEVGRGGRNTVASALVDRKDGRIVRRRIDVRATRADWQTGALAHELAHVVLADRFAAEALPRWLDEGMAILADSREKQQQHRHSLKRAMATGSQFRLAELMALGDYPPAERWGTFYGQSASLVAYLVAEQGHARFVEFVELALDRGYDHALRQVYRFDVGELERRWQHQLTAPSDAASVESRPNHGATSASTSAG